MNEMSSYLMQLKWYLREGKGKLAVDLERKSGCTGGVSKEAGRTWKKLKVKY